jgi:sigma-B regulation protein RsbU (phosphoserine phosphatase)
MPQQQLPAPDALFEHAPCGLLLTDPDGTLRIANATFCRWLGYQRDDIVGQRRLQDLFTMGGRVFHQTHWAPLLHIQGSVAEVELELLHRDGHAVPMLLNAIRRQHGEAVFDEVSLMVVADRHKYERELLSARRNAEDAFARLQEAQRVLAHTEAQLRVAHDQAEVRAQFAEQMVGIVSHDLRNPLQAILMSTYVLGRSQLTNGQTGSVGRIVSSATRAQRLIADLLDFTQARLGRGLAVTPREIDLRALAAGSLDELASAFPGRELRHRHEGPHACVADPDRLVQLIGNLVSNALSYGASDRPVTLATAASEDGFEIRVHNEGQPIAADLLPVLFEPMSRGINTPDTMKSVGLGLFIVREIALAHRGSVHVSSNAEGGTTFVVRCPPLEPVPAA